RDSPSSDPLEIHDESSFPEYTASQSAPIPRLLISSLATVYGLLTVSPTDSEMAPIAQHEPVRFLSNLPLGLHGRNACPVQCWRLRAFAAAIASASSISSAGI